MVERVFADNKPRRRAVYTNQQFIDGYRGLKGSP